jgi:hypothetical protein
MDIRAVIVAVIAVVALAGIALAAEAQREEFLYEQELGTGFQERDSVSGNLVALTGVLVAGALAAAAVILARGNRRRRWAGGLVIFLSAYLIVLMLQTGMFQYLAEDARRSALFNISPLISNGPATPSTFIGPVAILMMAGLGMQQAMRHMAGPAAPMLPGQPPVQALSKHMARRFLAAMILVTPFVGVTVVGNLRLLIALPYDQPATVPYLIVLPLAALAAAAMLVVGGIKAWQLAHAAADPRFAIVAKDAWEGLRKAEWVILAAVGGLALLATILQPLNADIVEAGAFNLNMRTHSQAQMFLLLVFIPWMGLHRPVMQALVGRSEPDATPSRHLIVYWILLGLAVLAGGAATFLWDGAMWAWLILVLPMVILAFVAVDARDALVPAMLAALILWAIGNTVSGFFQLNTTGRITWHMQPGLLALWRTLAVILLAVAVTRSSRAALSGVSKAIAWPMAAGMGTAVAIIAFFELPFSAWIIHANQIEFVGIGTLVASQDPSVRGVLHGISGLAAFATGLAASRIYRPEWFGGRRPAPVPSLAADLQPA